TIKRFVDKNPSLAEVEVECREAMIDNAESALFKAVLAGEGWACCFFLKTQGRKRGYVEKQLVVTPGKDAGDVKPTYTAEQLKAMPHDEVLRIYRATFCTG